MKKTVLRILFGIEGGLVGYFLYNCFREDMGIAFPWLPFLVCIGILGGLAVEEGIDNYMQEELTLFIGIFFLYPLARLLQWAIAFIMVVAEILIAVIVFFK